MTESIIEVAGNHPLIFLGLVGLGLLLAVILFVAAIRVTRWIIKLVTFFLSVILILILAMITLLAAENILSALAYTPPETQSAPAEEPPAAAPSAAPAP